MIKEFCGELELLRIKNRCETATVAQLLTGLIELGRRVNHHNGSAGVFPALQYQRVLADSLIGRIQMSLSRPTLDSIVCSIHSAHELARIAGNLAGDILESCYGRMTSLNRYYR